MITVYVLQGARKRYVGITNNLARRIREHNSGRTKGAQVIGNFKLLHTEECLDYNSFKTGQGREYLNSLYDGTGSACGG